MTTDQFSALMQQYERLVYTICYQFVKDHALAQDLTQETFLAAYLHRDDCPPDSYKPWLARIATNKAKDTLKSAYNRRVQATQDDAMPQQCTTSLIDQPEDLAVDKDEAQEIRAMILTLKEPYLMVSKLYFIDEMPVEIIAKRLDRPPKTVHTQIYRAKIMLQKQIEGRNRNGSI